MTIEQTLERLCEQMYTFEMIFNQAPIGITLSYCCDPAGSDESVVRINLRFEEITGRSKQELIRLGWAMITHPEDLEEEMQLYRKLQSGEIKSYSIDKRFIKPDGSIVWVHVIVSHLKTSGSRPSDFMCLVQDITERKLMEKALDESERSKSVLFSHLPGLAYRCKFDEDWTMQYVSQGCFNLTGYRAESLLHNREVSFNDIISPEYRESLRNEWAKILPEKKPFKYEYEIITAAGEKKWVLEMGQGIYDENNEVEALEGIVLDISDRKAIENELLYNNSHNRWTGLYNRDYLVAMLKRDAKLKATSKRALMGINLSMVQILTLNYGFQYSSNLVKKAAEALSRYCSDNCFLFHPHDERFLFYVFDYKDKTELLAFGKRISETLEGLFASERIGGGIGIVEIEPSYNELDIDLLLRKILIASERSVRISDRNFEIYVYDEAMEASVNRERDIVETLNEVAFYEYSNDHLFLQYQPIMHTGTGAICGFEALARLRTDKFGMISPAEFIPIAERTKLILPIGEKIIVQAFRFLNRLKEKGYDDIEVSVNISVIQLLEPDFVNRFFALINLMDVNPKNVGIEITESVFAVDYEYINNVIENLRGAGIHIAIDDFGKGYSSLAREKGLKIDYVKIDKFFLDGLLTDPGKSITGDIISMSRKLGHRTIAEGVEHDAQLQYLKEHGCDKIQGYLISKPLDEDDAMMLLQKHNQTPAQEMIRPR